MFLCFSHGTENKILWWDKKIENPWIPKEVLFRMELLFSR